MEKHIWNKVNCNLKSSSHPSPRWGHSCCIVGDNILYFGGYADSTYMNDLWSFNTLTMEWTEIQTSGDIPSHRSNCSMCFDEKNNSIVLFGGGAPNKKRFNSIHLLDWNTKQWKQILPKENQQAPWERTYHTAELFYPYLVIFGGEGMTDLDDVWTFNFETLSWKEVCLEKDSPKPCARRFHSSCKIGNQFFIIAGCHGKYRCLNDIYSMDVSEILKNGNFTLRWKQRKIQGSTFLTRWGHSSSVYEDKIYIFGGRFSNDLNDILVVDLQKQTMKAMKTNVEVPKARRRHSACFVGSNMIIFGGFNGEYFNDLYYINVFQTKKKIEARNENTLSKTNFIHLLGNQQFADGIIISAEEEEIPVHKALIKKFFSCERKMQEFLQELESSYSKKDILEILQYLYRGYGQEEFDNNYLSLTETFEISLPESENDKQIHFFKKLFNESKEFLSIVPKKSNIITSPVIDLSEDEYINFLEVMRSEIYCDASIVFNNEYCLPVSKTLLKLNSEYFNALFSSNFAENNEIHLDWQCSKTFIIVFEVMINYLSLGRVVISKQFEMEHWTLLAQLAEYYTLSHLKEICEQELCSWANDNCEKLMNLSMQFNLKNLAIYCADSQIKLMVNKQEKYPIQFNQNEDEKINQKRQNLLKSVYGLLRFDILQSRIESQNRLQSSYKKKETEFEEKENFQNNIGI